MSERVDISRREFTDACGIVPPDDVIGMCFSNADGTAILVEFVFTDPDPQLPYGSDAQIKELERLLTL